MRALVLIISVVLATLAFYFGMPVFAFGFCGWAVFLAFISFLIGINFIDFDSGELPRWVKTFWISSGVILIGFLIIIIPIFSTWSLFRASSYRNLIGEPKKSDISSDLNPISPENIVIIDEFTAMKLGEKKLTETNTSLGSEVVLGDFTLQKIKDKLYYVSPLLHSGFFKWFKNSSGTPGYIMVNALNDKDIKLVQEVNEKKVIIKYQPNAYFQNDLERLMYFNGYANKGLTDFSFELDDEGNPFWCVTVYDRKIGYSGKDAVGIAVVDPQNGDIQYYTIDKAPLWIDRIQPLSFVEEQLNDWGYYVNGWLNPSDKGRLKTTYGSSLVYGDDGICYFYVGLTSVGKDDASSGFCLINSRTKDVKIYEIGGATENAAMKSAEGKWPEKGYHTTFPRPYNVDGHFTYIMALKDEEGLIKAVAMVNYKSYEIVGIGADLKSALRDYKSALLGAGNALSTNKSGTLYEVSSIVKRIEKDVQQGQTYYYVILENSLNKMFRLTSNISESVIITEVGDNVSVNFRDGGNSVIDVDAFNNKDFVFQKTKGQIGVEKYFKQVNDSIKEKQNVKDADIYLKSLSDKEKNKIIENSRKK